MLPPAIGAAIYFIWVRDGGIVGFAVLFAYAYVFAGLPSLVHAALMELYYRVFAHSDTWLSVAFSALNGLAAGAAVVALSGNSFDGPWPSMEHVLIVCGAITGLSVGAIVKVCGHCPPPHHTR
jgi:hypothetical protein